jgi:hypothetical protein
VQVQVAGGKRGCWESEAIGVVDLLFFMLAFMIALGRVIALLFLIYLPPIVGYRGQVQFMMHIFCRFSTLIQKKKTINTLPSGVFTSGDCLQHCRTILFRQM